VDTDRRLCGNVLHCVAVANLQNGLGAVCARDPDGRPGVATKQDLEISERREDELGQQWLDPLAANLLLHDLLLHLVRSLKGNVTVKRT
jgi:hypothetical protein